MADPKEQNPYQIGYAKPPRENQFRPGRSGNPKGRPKRAKNFATAIEQELQETVTITENGRRRRVSKREVVAKRLVNRAAEGDPRLLPVLLNEMRPREQAATDRLSGGPEQQPLIDSILDRIRAAAAPSAASSSSPAARSPDQHLQLELPLEPGGQPDGGEF